ncbi:SusE domain-containing protein [Litoribacter alkaliphilus]|uniref:SusE domain-containing protein n=1 Tax=Litoribacter ruber TaxID=702568 RepID=A0AAP2CHD1_9BACT|nr:SusE domain-containing protein [Litoribacter alkaliphilus]MBS9523256.1 SusE domain-containing protein [Litoribacter alkaliphilus]
MKSLFNIFFAVFALAFAWACTEEMEQVRISENPEAATITSPSAGQSFVLTEEDAGERMVFNYEPADFGYSAAVSYTVQMDVAGNEFANPTEVGTTNGTSLDLSYAEFNQKLVGKGLAPEEEAEIEIRVRSSVGSAVAANYSSPITMVVTPYLAALTFPRMYVPGDYQGWNPENENTVIYSVEGDDVYEGYVHILGGSGAFKVNEEPNWDVNYGGVNGVLEQNGPDIILDEPFGTFRLKVDLNAGTYEIGTRRVWGIIGSATPGDWETDTPLEFNADENVLTLTLDLVAGEMKFRADNVWDIDYGANSPEGGVLEQGGPNIPVEEDGNYTITMDWKVPGEITYSIVKN